MARMYKNTVPESEEIRNAQQSAWDGVDAPWTLVNEWAADRTVLKNSWRERLVPNGGKLLRKKIVFFKLVTWSKGEIQMMSKARLFFFFYSK